MSDAGNEAQASEYYHEAEARYAAGDLAGARDLMQHAYELSGRAELLFNLGELERELGHCAPARDDYAEYLLRVPNGKMRDEAARNNEALATQCPPPVEQREQEAVRPAPEPAPVAAPVPPPEPYWTPARATGWAVIGVGVAAAAGATYFAVQASRDESSLEAQVRNERATGSGFTESDKQLELDGQRSANWARGLALGAVGLVGVGASLLILNPHPTPPAKAAISVAFDARSVQAVYFSSF